LALSLFAKTAPAAPDPIMTKSYITSSFSNPDKQM
jgi:hypothetical protein